jgi:hypothetical protein
MSAIDPTRFVTLTDGRADMNEEMAPRHRRMNEFFELVCPHCGETIDTAPDPVLSEQDYVEDCPVCCRPNRIRIVESEGRDGFAVEISADI